MAQPQPRQHVEFSNFRAYAPEVIDKIREVIHVNSSYNAFLVANNLELISNFDLPQEKKEVYSTEARSCKIMVKYLASQTFIFYSLYNDEERKMLVYLIKLDPKSGEVSAPVLIASPKINFSLLISPDKEHFAIICLFL